MKNNAHAPIIARQKQGLMRLPFYGRFSGVTARTQILAQQCVVSVYLRTGLGGQTTPGVGSFNLATYATHNKPVHLDPQFLAALR